MGSKIDVVLLAGFLGAGKTTVLNELIRTFGTRKLGLLVNDFGEVPVDGSFLKSENPELLEGGHKIYEIGNGSIFCSCLKAPFLYGLKYFATQSPDLLFIEASGLSDPSSMQKILTEHGLEDSFEIRRVVTLVDPVKYKALVHVLDVIGRQIQAADQILVNKCDLVPERELKELLGDLETRTGVPVQTGSFGDFDYGFILSGSSQRRLAERESCNTPETRPGSLFLEGNLESEQVLKDFMSRIEGASYRVKGFLKIAGKMLYVSDNGRGYTITPAEKTGIREGLTVLCPRENESIIASLWKEVRGVE